LAAQLLLEKILKHDIRERTVIASKHCRMVDYMRKIENICTSACEEEAVKFATLNTFKLYSFWYSFIENPIVSVFQIPVESALRLDGKDFIDTAHIFYQRVHYWVINNPKQMKELLLKGADGIVTDRIDLAIQVFKELGLKKNSSKSPTKYYKVDEEYGEIHQCEGTVCLILFYFFQCEQWIVISSLVLLISLIMWQSSSKSKDKVS